MLERDPELAGYVTDRLVEGWTPEQISCHLERGVERGLRYVSTETIDEWFFRPGQKAARLSFHLEHGKAKRGRQRGRTSKDRIKDKGPVAERSNSADARAEPGPISGNWGKPISSSASAPVPCSSSTSAVTRITLLARLPPGPAGPVSCGDRIKGLLAFRLRGLLAPSPAEIGSKASWPLMGKTAAETIAVMMAVLGQLGSSMRGSITFDNDTTFARHSLLRGLLAATTCFCDAPFVWIRASRQKGGALNANGRIRQWLPRTADLDAMTEADIQKIAMTLDLTPRKCLGFKSPVEAFLAELGKKIDISFHRHVALRA